MINNTIAGLMLGFCVTVAAHAESYPGRPITLIVPFSAGGATDNLAREIAENLRTSFKQTVLVENKPGAGTTIASGYVARARPDGYTVLFAASSLGIAPSLYKNAGYDPLKDFEPVTLMASITHVLVVNPAVPAKNVRELIQWVKANPGKVDYASVGAGTTTHLEAELFKKMTGVEMSHVPYKGSQPALVDVIAGRVPVMFDALASSGPMARDGRLRILGVTTEKRSKVAPDIPTIAENGLKGFDVMTWMGLLVPKGTPKSVTAQLNDAVQKALARPEVQSRLQNLGFDTIGYGPEQFSDYLKHDIRTWSTLIKEQNITIN
jgi:tripartite-type tricarboxylate transporter receptor subunit TctC